MLVWDKNSQLNTNSKNGIKSQHISIFLPAGELSSPVETFDSSSQDNLKNQNKVDKA